jgi:hypothetical protein
MIINKDGLAGKVYLLVGLTGQAIGPALTKEAAHGILLWNRFKCKNLPRVYHR